MACGIRKQAAAGGGAATGTDMDSIFKPRTSAAGANVAIRCVTGTPNQDFAQRYEPRGTSPKVADVGYRTPGGVDISNTFMDLAYNPVVTIASLQGLHKVGSKVSPADVSVSLVFDTDGTWRVAMAPASTLASGTWLADAGGGAASAYEVRFTTSDISGEPTITGGGVWNALSAPRSCNVFVSGTDVYGAMGVVVEVRRVSDSVIVARADTIDIWAESLSG